MRIQKGDRASVCVWLNDVEKSISPERRRSGRVHAGWGSNSVVGLSCLSVLSARPVLCSALLCSCALCPCTTAARPPACVRASLGPSSLCPGLSLSSPAAALSLHGRPLCRKGETPCRPASQPAKEKGRKVATRRSARRQKYSPLFFFFFAPRTCPVDDAPPPGCRTYKRQAISRLSDFSPRERRGEIDWVWLVGIWPPHICFFRFFRLFFSFFFFFFSFIVFFFIFFSFFSPRQHVLRTLCESWPTASCKGLFLTPAVFLLCRRCPDRASFVEQVSLRSSVLLVAVPPSSILS